MKPWKVAIQSWSLKNLFCASDLRDVLTIQWANKERGIAALLVGGNKLPQGEAANLVKEIRLLKELPSFYRILESMKGNANEMMFKKSKNIDDLVFSKAMLYNIGVLEELIELISLIQEVR